MLEREEPFAGEYVARALESEGVDVRIGATPARVDRMADGIVSVTLDDGDEVRADEMLVATGRRPSRGVHRP